VPVVVALIICASAAATAVTGFGFNLLSTPLLTFVYPPRLVVVLTLLLGTGVSGMLLLRRDIRGGIDWNVVRPLFLSSLVGMPAGVAVLLWAQPRELKILITGLTALFALVMLSGFRPRLRDVRYGVIAVGVLSGFLSTSTSLNGLPVAFYLLTQRALKDRFRANMVVYVFLATGTSIMLLAAGGTMSRSVLMSAARLLPALILGFAGGSVLAGRLSDRTFEAAVLMFLVFVGLLGLGSAVR
jgi:uncharacterized protein